MLSTLVMLQISVLNCSNRHFHCFTVQTLELVNNLRLYYTAQCSVADIYGYHLLQNCHYKGLWCIKSTTQWLHRRMPLRRTVSCGFSQRQLLHSAHALTAVAAHFTHAFYFLLNDPHV